MRRLACYVLEGLMRQGPHQVWITLGSFPSFELADAATRTALLHRPGIGETRILPLFRDSGDVELQPAARMRPASRQSWDGSVTVA